jgi:uncharacterized protein YjbI with pentapeptide repeats
MVTVEEACRSEKFTMVHPSRPLVNHKLQALEDGLTWSEALLARDVSGQGGQLVSFDRCRISGLQSLGTSFDRPRDVLVENSDMAGADTYQASLDPRRVQSVPMSGVDLANATMRDIRISHGRQDGADFQRVESKTVMFEKSDLHDIDFRWQTSKVQASSTVR